MFASLGKFTNYRDLPKATLLNVFVFVAGEVGFVEGDCSVSVWVVSCRLSVPPRGQVSCSWSEGVAIF